MNQTAPTPTLELERNNAGHLFIGVTEYNDEGCGVRSYVLSSGTDSVADSVMVRRFQDMARLMSGNVDAGPEGYAERVIVREPFPQD